MSEQIGFNFDEPEQPKKVMRALSELPKESAEEIQKAKEKAKEKAILRDAEAKADQAKQATKERNKAAKAGQGSLDLSGAGEARAKLQKMAAEHNATVKDERTYKRFGEPVNRASGSAGAKIELEKGMMGSNMPKPKLAAGGKVKSASARADGCCIRGRTRA